jgi:hypothetical protein
MDKVSERDVAKNPPPGFSDRRPQLLTIRRLFVLQAPVYGCSHGTTVI